MTALDIACRICDAQAGEWCGHTYLLFHAERIEDAAIMTRVADPVSSKEFADAVIASGLV